MQHQDRGEGPSRRKSSKKYSKSPYKNEEDASSQVGVSKIKSALRQTRRLLAKDNLAADLRVETERRLKSLESDLAVAEVRKKERAYALKYHKVKFFERQKISRKIKQLKAQLGADVSSKASVSEPDNQLFELRVDLNYILHYPKLERYISLFPPSARHKDNTNCIDEVHAEVPVNASDSRRQAIRDDIKRLMENGELSCTPEIDLHKTKGTTSHKSQTRTQVTRDDASGSHKKNFQIHKDGPGGSTKPASTTALLSVEDDDFFDDAGDDV